MVVVVVLVDGFVDGSESSERSFNKNPAKPQTLTPNPKSPPPAQVRNSGSEERVVLSPPRVVSLEDAVGWVTADELIEATPTAVRLRKRSLVASERRSDRRRGGAADAG